MTYYYNDMIKQALLNIGECSHDVLGLNHIIDKINYEDLERICGKESYSLKGISFLEENIKEIMESEEYKFYINEE